MTWHRWLCAVRAHDDGGAWRDALRERLASQVARPFGHDDELVDVAGDPMGRYRFAGADELARDFGDAPWCVAHHPCPYVGELVGAVTWEWWDGHHGFDDRRYLVEHLIAAADGVVVRTDTGAWFDPVVLATRTLGEVVQKHGFDDGGFFLREVGRDAEYGRYLRDALAAALAAHDLRGDFITYGTSHNPIRIDQWTPRKHESQAACWERFRAIADTPIALWGVDVAGLGGAAFRALLADPPDQDPQVGA